MINMMLFYHREKLENILNSSPNENMIKALNCIIKAGADGITTREVATQCNISIFSARNWLSKLEAEGFINKKETPRTKVWFLLNN